MLSVAHIEEDGQSLYPVIVQDVVSRQVVMMAYANQTALTLTRKTGWAHFYSRSRRQLWMKGETSGHRIRVQEVLTDCDEDSCLYLAEVDAPVCHRNTPSCFADGKAWVPDPLLLLNQIVRKRLSGNPDPGSYTWRLFEDEIGRVAQKVGEEAVEVVVESINPGSQDNRALVGEVADLLYHLTVLLVRTGVSLEDVSTELMRRRRG